MAHALHLVLAGFSPLKNLESRGQNRVHQSSSPAWQRQGCELAVALSPQWPASVRQTQVGQGSGHGSSSGLGIIAPLDTAPLHCSGSWMYPTDVGQDTVSACQSEVARDLNSCIGSLKRWIGKLDV